MREDLSYISSPARLSSHATLNTCSRLRELVAGKIYCKAQRRRKVEIEIQKTNVHVMFSWNKFDCFFYGRLLFNTVLLYLIKNSVRVKSHYT